MSQLQPGNTNEVLVKHTDLKAIVSNLKDPVLIVGMHNSGTSILAEVLHNSGLFLRANMRHNESRFFSIFINNKLIMGGGSNWAKLPLMDIEEVMLFKDTIGPFIRKYWIADYLQWGYNGVSPWGIKDPRLCVLLPLYLEIFPRAKVVHIRRDPNDVAASLCDRCKKDVGRLDNFNHWKQLTLEHINRVLGYSRKCYAYYELTYEDFCSRSIETTKALFNFLNLTFTEDTRDLLSQVETSRIGSYNRHQRRKTKIRYLKRLFGINKT